MKKKKDIKLEELVENCHVYNGKFQGKYASYAILGTPLHKQYCMLSKGMNQERFCQYQRGFIKIKGLQRRRCAYEKKFPETYL